MTLHPPSLQFAIDTMMKHKLGDDWNGSKAIQDLRKAKLDAERQPKPSAPRNGKNVHA